MLFNSFVFPIFFLVVWSLYLCLKHKPETFFAGEYADKVWQRVSGYFKKQSEAKSVRVATPQGPPIR